MMTTTSLTPKKLDGFTFPSAAGPFSLRGWGVWCAERGAFIQLKGARGPRATQPYVPCGGLRAVLEVVRTVAPADTFAVPHLPVQSAS